MEVGITVEMQILFIYFLNNFSIALHVYLENPIKIMKDYDKLSFNSKTKDSLP